MSSISKRWLYSSPVAVVLLLSTIARILFNECSASACN